MSKKSKDIIQRNANIRKWLTDHWLINIAALCRIVNYDRANFWGFQQGNRDLTEEHISAIENILIEYGFKK